MADTATAARPQPTTDLDKALADLNVHGACIIENALEVAKLAEVRTALYRAAEADRTYGWAQQYQYGGDDHVNQRVWNLPSRDPVFCDLVEHPVAMHFVKQVLGWPALLSSMSANITAGGGQSMILHADQGYMPPPWSRPLGVNVAWCVDDFTAENGATCYIAGSNHWDGQGQGQDLGDKLVPLEAPAGSAIVMEGRLLHTNGVNRNGVQRAGIFSWYTLPIYLPQENWFLSLNPAVRQFGSETLQTLFGFRPQVMGRINGLDRI
ncbi:phytanoyl-CoA dioxygenase family protein [Phenylobacterium sp. LjRoot219]|uniref:phytanoyl-CoA dioxygenase family protein n=1 Tax=Phenylobacterium sp. LjRoot219 TaxID=3342283 RepID=UPI003ECE4C65